MTSNNRSRPMSQRRLGMMMTKILGMMELLLKLRKRILTIMQDHGLALEWFYSLPPDSISRFQELAKQFEDHFAASAIYLHDSDYLITIKQGPQESLKDYITHFTKVAMRIPDLHPEVHLHAIKSGFRPGKFQEAIAVAKPKTLAEFREKAKGQIDIEELRQARKTDKSSTTKDDDKPRDNKKTFKPVPRY
ncbi:uncharacterized protein LOC107633508 [Arachis ipaensis]|uniref:uncharacterized protein LOC107633508 n=1 Tax=Arachis ipaensis TaxID=130454 RepID=UPI0007AFCE1D|nr:uncharacterized protein LOC107633508 [Arachis ipaensis]XP_025640623.1 uncharacterized protein LOC112735280 [Arachis hypogaea]